MEIWLVTAILVVAMILLVTEKLPVDLTSIGIMVVLVLSGILAPQEAIAGFASPAVITVWAVYIVSAGLFKTGVADILLVMETGSRYRFGKVTVEQSVLAPDYMQKYVRIKEGDAFSTDALVEQQRGELPPGELRVGEPPGQRSLGE